MLDNEDISDSLIWAVREGRLDRVSDLISKYGLSYSTAWSEGYALLLDAVDKKHPMITNLLLSHGSPVNISKDKEKPSNTPPNFGSGNTELKIVEILFDQPANTPLHFAVRNGDMVIVQMLLDKGADVDATGYNDKTSLHIAAESGHLEIVEILLKHGACVDFACGFGGLGPRAGYTPLGFAVQNGNKEMIKLLISHGADVNTKAKDGKTLLHIAVEKGDLHVIESLLNDGANPNSAIRNGSTPLYLAVQKGSEEIVKLLLKNGAKVDTEGNDGITPLHIAAERGNLQIAERLLKEGAYVDPVYGTLKWGGYTPLCFAVRNRHEKVVKLLLENGANVDATDKKGNTILYFSVENAKPVDLLIVHHIVRFGPDINHQGNRRAYKIAIYNYDKAIVEIFLELFGSTVSLQGIHEYYKLLYVVAENGYLRIVEQFLNKREEIAKLSESHVVFPTQKLNSELLGVAVKKEHKEIVEFLLRHGADIKAIEGGKTELHFTGITENVNDSNVKSGIAKLLLRRQAVISAQNSNFPTLHIAVQNGYVKVVEALLEHNADVNSAPKFGITPLHIAAKTGNKVITKMLLNKGASVNAQQCNLLTALHIAAYKGHKEVVEVLLRCGAKVNFGHGSDLTPLHIAAQRGFPDIVEILLQFGAEIDTRDGYGRTPLQLASRELHKPIVTALLNHGSDINSKSCENRLAIDYAGGFDEDVDEYEIECDCYDDSVFPDSYPREETLKVLKHHVVKLKTANLYVIEEDLLSNSIEINDFRNECEEEIARMKSEKISKTNVSFFDILTKSTSPLATYAEEKDIVQVFRSEDYKISFPIYASMMENNFGKEKRRKTLLKESINCFFTSNFYEVPYTCKKKIFSYLSDSDLKMLTHTFGRRKELLEQGYRFFHFLFISFSDFPYECTEKIFSYLSDEDLRILVEACKPDKVRLE